MKKTSILKLILAFSLLAPAPALAQSKPLFPFNPTTKSAETTVAPVLPAPATATAEPVTPIQEIAGDTIDLTDIKSQPLPIRRQMVAAELGEIALRLNVLYDKVKAATDRLTQNGINTDDSQTALAAAALSLADAKLTIDGLALAANDPANETAIVLIVDGATFKDGVIKAEDTLRAARTSIITSLLSLKAAVSASITTDPVN